MGWSSTEWTTVAAVASAIAATGSAVAGVGAWLAARRSAGSSERAADAAASLTAIESERTHRDLIPEFRFRLDEGYQGVSDNGELSVELVLLGSTSSMRSPSRFSTRPGETTGRVGCLTASRRRPHGSSGGRGEFNTGAALQVENNKITKPRRYSRVDGKNWDRLSLKRTRPGSWMTGTIPDAWRQQVQGPMRLTVTCHREGYAPWYLMYAVDPSTSSS